MYRLILMVFAAIAIAACVEGERAADSGARDSATADSPAAEPNPVKGIGWFEGSVDEAFAAARESGKPIYLYWGAEWCPPCHAIAATVFRSPAFIERSKLFVPVYLDGDTENAQSYGERFGVFGYPTMIVFDPDGRELTRIPGGIDLQAYANVLDLTLSKTAGAADLVAKVTGDASPLSPADCRLLAYYSWEQDLKIFAERDAADSLRSVYDACPAESSTERSLLYFQWLDARLDASEEDETGTLSPEEKAEAVERVGTVLADDGLTRANVFTVLFSGPRIVGAVTEPGSADRTALVDAFTRALDRLESDETVYLRERLYTLIGRVRFERLSDPEAAVSDALQERIRRTVEWADAATPSVYERQPVINALGNILDEAGMDDVAKPLLLAELDRSLQPYYFMVSLADIEQRAGNTTAAIDWLRKAHESAQGPATRFQWGYYYLVGLVEMTPDDAGRIRELTVSLIDEVQNSMGFYHRPKAQLGRLEQRLMDWGSEDDGRKDSLLQIRQSVLQICSTAAVQGEARSTCESFLERV